MLAEAMVGEFARAFHGVGPAEAESLADAFAFENVHGQRAARCCAAPLGARLTGSPWRPMSGAKRVTLETIARETGVSITTISKVLNGRGDVAPSTRERIEAHLQEREYARPGSSRSDVLEVVLHELDPHWSVEVVDGVRAAAAAAGSMCHWR